MRTRKSWHRDASQLPMRRLFSICSAAAREMGQPDICLNRASASFASASVSACAGISRASGLA